MAILAGILMATSSTQAASGTWATGVSGTWSDAGNWQDDTIADGVAATGSISFNSSAQSVNLDSDRTLGILNIGVITPNSSYALTGTGVLIMDNDGEQAQINSLGTNSGISAAIRMTEGGLRIATNEFVGSGSAGSFVLGGISSIAASGTQTLAINHGGGSLFSVAGVSDGTGPAKVALLIEAGTIQLSNNSFTGGITFRSGWIRTGTSGLGSNLVTVGEAGGSNVRFSANSSDTYANDFVITGAGTATFDNTAITGVFNPVFTGSFTLEKNLGVVVLSGGSYTFTGPIAGEGAILLSPNGVANPANSLYLSGSNTFSGGVRVDSNSNMRVVLGSAEALGSGTFRMAAINGSTGTRTQALNFRIDNNSGSALALTTNNAQQWKNFIFQGSDDLDMGTGSVTVLSDAGAIITALDKKFTVGGVISGNKLIGNAGSGTVAFTGANTYTGATAVGGILAVSSLADGGVASNIGASSNTAENLILNRGTLQYSGGDVSTDRLFTIGNGGATIESSGTGAMNFTNTGDIASTDTVSMDVVAGANTFAAGSTTINLAATTNPNSTANLAVGMSVTGVGISPGAVISEILDGNRIVLASGSATATATATTLTFGALDRTLNLTGTNTGDNTISGNLVDAATKELGVTKSGAGKWVLNGANTYTGTTRVNAGTLVIGSSGSISDTSTVVVGSGGNFAYNSATARSGAITIDGNGGSRAILSGTGTLDVALTLDNVGDTLSPGNSPGILALGVDQSWESFTYQWETNDFVAKVAGTNFDQIAIDGGLTLTGGTGDYVLDLYSLTAANIAGLVENYNGEDQSWTILTASSGITGFDASAWTILTSNFTSNPAWTGVWTLSQSGNSLVLDYAAVPEPSTYALLTLGLLAVVVLRRKRRVA